MRFTLRSTLARRKKTSGQKPGAAEQRIKLLTALVILATAAARLILLIWSAWSGAPSP